MTSVKRVTHTISLMPTPPTAQVVRQILPVTSDEQRFRLRWEQHTSNQQATFAKLLESGSFCDVAIACQEKLINVHRLVLASSSSYFEAIFSQFEKRDPVVILKDIKYETMLALIQFIYKGEVCLEQSHLSDVLEAAHALKIKGLSEDISELGKRRSENGPPTKANEIRKPISPSKRGRPRKVIAQIPLADQVSSNNIHVVKRKIGRPRKENVKVNENLENVAKVEASPSTKSIQHTNIVVSPPPVQVKSKEGLKSKINTPESPSKSNVTAKLDSSPIPDTTPKPDKTLKSDKASKQDKASKPVSSSAPSSGNETILFDDYIKNGGTNTNYWKEPWVTRVMDAIKCKEMSLQEGAKHLGIKYQSLYGRYRVHHGYLISRMESEPKKRKMGDPDKSNTSSIDVKEEGDLDDEDDCDKIYDNDSHNEWDPSLNLEPYIQIDEDRKPR